MTDRGPLRRPADGEEASSLLASAGPAPALTGSAPRDPPSAAREALREEGRPVLSTERMAGLLSYRPEDLTVTVGSGTRLAELQSRLREEGQWLPVSAAALARSAGGAVAAAPPGPFAEEYGPLRRQVLAVRVVSYAGERLDWGRAVMKNVAGYDLPRLACGSRGRLGLLTRVTFRVWPLPGTRRRYRLRAGDGTDAGAGGLAGATVGVEAGRDWRPEAEAWQWSAEADPPSALLVELGGSEASVEARAERLERWADARGLELRRFSGGRSALAAAPPDRGRRAPRPSTLRFRVEPRYVARAAETLVASGRARRVTALPRQGLLEARYPPGEGPARALAGPSWPADGATATVDRGGPALHEAAAGRRDPDRVALERRVLDALDGGDRVWAADFV